MSARDIAGAARNLVRIIDESDPAEIAPAVHRMRQALLEWDAAGHPEQADAAGERNAYRSALGAFIKASGEIRIGVFGVDGLATQATELRTAASVHMANLVERWHGASTRIGGDIER